MLQKSFHLVLVSLALVLLLALINCDTASSPDDLSDDDSAETGDLAVDTTDAANLVSAPVNLAEIIRRMQLSFRVDGDDLVGGGQTYVVRVNRVGEFRLTPVFDFPDDGRDEIRGAALRLTTQEIARGGFVIDAPVAATERTDDGAVAIDRGAVVEWLENRDNGVEQAWTFAEPPAGRGDLEVRVAVAGQTFTGVTDSGLHFADPETELGFCYGHALWIDANGVETEIPAIFDAGEIILTVPAAVVATSAFPADLDPLVSPEIGTDSPIYLPARNRQAFPVAVFGSVAYMVVWEDRRVSETNTESDVYAMRINKNGSLLTPGGIVVSGKSGNQKNPDVSFNGSDFLVVWDDDRNGQLDIYGSRLSTAGAVRDPEGILISSAAGDQAWPVVATGSPNWLVTWTDGRNSGKDIYGTRVATNGTVLDDPATGVAIGAATGDLATSAVAFDGGNFLVVWSDASGGDYDMVGRRFSPDGAPVGSQFDISNAGGDQRTPAVAFGGGAFLTTWFDSRGGGVDIYGAIIDTGGGVTVADIPVADPDGDQRFSAIAFDGNHFLVAWDDFRSGSSWDIYGARLDPDGTILDPNGFAICSASGNQYEPTIAFDGTNFFVAWHDYRAGGYPDVYGTRLTTAGVPLDGDGLILSLAANFQMTSAVAFDGANYLVVWEDQRDGEHWDIYGTRITPEGAVLDPAGIAICTAEGTQERPAVTFGVGGNYFVAWSDYRSGLNWDVYGTRVSTGGTVLDGSATGVAISTATADQLDPEIAYGNDFALVVWRDNRSGDYDIYGARINTSGAMVDPAGIAISTNDSAQTYPTVAFGTTQFLVVWEDTRYGPADLFSTRVQINGSVNSPTGIIVSTAAGQQLRPAAAWDGTNFFVVWADSRSGVSNVYGSRVNTGGGTVDPAGLRLSDLGLGRYDVDLAYDGTHYLVVWRETVGAPSTDVYGLYFAPTGAIVQGPFPISNATNVDEISPAVASSGSGRSLVTYYNFDRSTFYGAMRVFARTVHFFRQGWECTENEECLTGFCVDGFCCNTECGNNDPNDCQVCSVEAGAVADGTCTILDAGVVCRSEAGLCDVTEQCDGSSGLCPDDQFVVEGIECRAAVGLCDAAERCTGALATCPVDELLPDTYECRPATDVCDTTEFCTGQDVTCPTNRFQADTVECRPGVDDCDSTEFCTGIGAPCPADQLMDDGSPCDDGEFCNGVDTCLTGVCAEHAGDPCEEDETCDEEDDHCRGADDDDDDDDTVDDDDIRPPNSITGGPSDADDDDDDDNGCCGC